MRRTGLVVTGALLAALALLSTAGAVTIEPVIAPLWAPAGSYLLVTTDTHCHIDDCDGYGPRPGGQDVVLIDWDGWVNDDARVMNPVEQGRAAVITRIWTADGCYIELGSNWVCEGHGYGNAIDLYVGQHPEYGAVVYRMAHMRTDGLWFYWGYDGIYSHYHVGEKLPYGFMLGYVGSTGNAGAVHLHWELIMGLQRFEPTVWWLDDIGVTYPQHDYVVDGVRHVCTVTMWENCAPLAPPFGFYQDDGGPVSVEQIPGYGAGALPVMPEAAGSGPLVEGKSGDASGGPGGLVVPGVSAD